MSNATPALHPATLDALSRVLPKTATACVDAIVAEVPGYDRAFDGRLRHNIEGAVRQALTTFIDSCTSTATPATERDTLEGARRLGEGEAATGRSTDALLSAYRVGARVAWQAFSEQALTCGEGAATIAGLAATTFAYIDELSAASLAGHTEAVNRQTQELARRRDHLAGALVTGESRTTLERLADNARWLLPTTLTALVLGDEPAPALVALLGPDTLWTPATAGPVVALVPDLEGVDRIRVLRVVRGHAAALGPRTVWNEVSESVRRAQRLLRLAGDDGVIDADDHLVDLLLAADERSAAQLAERAVAPLRDLSEAKQDVLRKTLLTWLLLLGRREDVANALHVHPQTVRYRMSQLRDLYGDALTTTDGVRDLVIGLLAAQTMETSTT